MEKYLLLDNTLAEMEAFVTEAGQPRYRARQLLDWLYHKQAVEFDELTNLPKTWRAELRATTVLTPFRASSVQTAADGTQKFLFELHDGETIESVCIPMKEHWTLCLSTQVGCALGCTFCLTGQQGLRRNLSAGEILGQILAIRRVLPPDQRVSNLVLMGMGEPLLNYEPVIKAIRMMLAEEGGNFSNRKITLSTAGIVPVMHRLGQEGFVINLAVSLNAPTDALRTELMPINATYPFAAVLDACRAYPLPERRRITFEYIMLHDLNDRVEHADALATILQGIRCKINLIPFNATDAAPYAPSSEERIVRFQERLLHRGYATFIRASKGGDILAACGQLRGRRECTDDSGEQ